MSAFALRSLAISAAALAGSVLLPTQSAQAHGSFTSPASRIWFCHTGNQENPSHPACAAAKAVAGSQLFYDWNGINQANANGNHQAVVPNGKLCSGNNPTFRGLDIIRSDWQTTNVRPGASRTFTFYATAPHATRDWVFYVTPQGWNPNSQLNWSNLQQFCRVGNVPLSAGNNYHITCTLPANRSGRAVIYNTWQRSDSTEAFYTCMDVNFTNSAAKADGGFEEAGVVPANNDLPVGTAVTLRVFNADGTDAEKIETVLGAGQTSVNDWTRRVSQEVNAKSRFARIGELQNGLVETKSGASNRVYLAGNRSFAFDVRLPESAKPLDSGHSHHEH